jgi:hypothetical protein
MSKPVKLSVGDKVEIKFDFPYGQDFGFYKWTGERIVFTVVDLYGHDRIKIVAPGYGITGNYGNGAIHLGRKSLRKCAASRRRRTNENQRVLSASNQLPFWYCRRQVKF